VFFSLFKTIEMWWVTLSNALFIFALRLTDVSMGTVRTIMVMRGMRKVAALIGFVEVSIWVVAISRVIGNVDSIWSVLGYSGGFAAGTLLGMWIEDKLALGHVYVHVISMDKGLEIAHQIRKAGHGATQMQAEGRTGPVHLIEVVAPRRQVKNILRLVNQVDAESFVTVEEARQVMRGYLRAVK
jgi:uncharacterized protein YebE (UPF0316 family)